MKVAAALRGGLPLMKVAAALRGGLPRRRGRGGAAATTWLFCGGGKEIGFLRGFGAAAGTLHASHVLGASLHLLGRLLRLRFERANTERGLLARAAQFHELDVRPLLDFRRLRGNRVVATGRGDRSQRRRG